VLTCIDQDEGQLHEPVLILISADAREPNHAVLGAAAELGQRESGADSGKETAPTGPPAVHANTSPLWSCQHELSALGLILRDLRYAGDAMYSWQHAGRCAVDACTRVLYTLQVACLPAWACSPALVLRQLNHCWYQHSVPNYAQTPASEAVAYPKKASTYLFQ
jgi:hypothetical protein